MADRRYFALRTSSGGRESAVFTGRQPRQAALKAASRGMTDIYLRERGTKKLHHFKGTRRRVAAPYNRPDWMAATVWKPNVRKVGIIRFERKRKAKKRTTRRRKAVRRKTTKRRTVRRKTTRRKAVRRKTTKRRTVKRKTTRRKTAKRRTTTKRRTTRRRRR